MENGDYTVERQTVDCQLSCPIGESFNILMYVGRGLYLFYRLLDDICENGPDGPGSPLETDNIN